jgi:thiopeptide-type bacteriocin biosynthesis protein
MIRPGPPEPPTPEWSSSSSSPSSARITPGRATTPRWWQANVELAHHEDAGAAANADSLFARIDAVVAALEATHGLDGYFFMRKAPGVRFRFRARDDGMAAVVTAALDELGRAGAVARWFPSCYEPETFQFGGAEAMELAHAHFFVDARAWWTWEKLRRADATRLSPEVFSLAVLNDLFVRMLDGAEEVWDVWCQLARLHDALPAAEPSPVPALTIADLVARVDGGERDLLARYADANAAYALGMRALFESGKLLWAFRLVLPFVALFHWNRYGFSTLQRRRMFAAMTAAWSTKHRITALAAERKA